MTPDFLLQLFTVICLGAATYGAIRKDIENIHRNIKDLSGQTSHAHKRIDDLLLQKRGDK